MLAINYTELRSHMKHHFDKVTNDYETMIITRPHNQNIVMMSEDAYNNLMETLHLVGTKANYDWLMESKKQLEQGQVFTHELLEDTE